MLQRLRERNPGIPFDSIQSNTFSRFGRVVDFPAKQLITICEQATVMPENGTCYVADMTELEIPDVFEEVQRLLRGEGSCQIGCCWGYNQKLNCLEYHRASEHNIAVSDLVLLLASQLDMEGNELSTDKVSAFYVPKGTVIEIYATTLHFCPCQVSDDGFRCIVVLPRGTNKPLEYQRSTNMGEEQLLWAKDKWLIAHKEAPAIQRGAYPGLQGVNYEIKY